MPELPEVETIKKYLAQKLIGETITSSNLFVEKCLKTNNLNDFKNLKTEKIISIERKAKYLILKTTNYSIFFHLRLEGKFKYEDSNNFDEKYCLAKFNFSNKKSLGFYDFRKFGTIDLIKNSDKKSISSFIDKTGPEPWNVDKIFFYTKIIKSSLAIKTLLLNQKLISGLGNIYVDEVLYACKIMPTRLSKNISKKESNCLIEKSILILRKAIDNNGTTIRTYEFGDSKGEYQNFLKVHVNIGKKCGPNNFVEKMKVNGRGTYYCPGVQK